MSSTECLIRAKCRLCNGHITPILTLNPTPLANGYTRNPDIPDPYYPLYLSRCDRCGHVQLPVEVDAPAMFSQYEYASGASRTMTDHLYGLAQEISDRLGRPSAIVEIGSNDGTLLERLQRHGHDVVGIEPARNMAEEANFRGLKTYCEYWDQDTWKGSGHGAGLGQRPQVDCIVAANVFAHVPDIRDFTRGVQRALRLDGWFVFEVGYLVDQLVVGKQIDVIYHEHRDFHCLLALEPFLAEHCLRIEDVQRIPTQGGSLRVWCRKQDPRGTEHAVAKILGEEHELLGSRAFGWKTWEIGAQRTASGIRDAVTSPDVGRVLCYGAAAKLTTLVHQIGVAPVAVVDDNPRKQGLYTPGQHAPILGQEQVDARLGPPQPHDTLLLSAYNMAEEVLGRIRRSPSQVLREARVLCPFPEPNYVEEA